MSFNSQQYLELSYAIPTSSTYSSVVERGVEPVSRLPENITVSTVSYTSTPQESSSQRLLEELHPGIRSVIASIVGKDVLRNIMVYNDPNYGYVIRLVVDLDAKQALELWQKLVEVFPYKRFGIVIGVKWIGRNNVLEDELVDYIVKIMHSAGLRLVARKPLSIVEEMLEEREKR
jgi:hypothetical protein